MLFKVGEDQNQSSGIRGGGEGRAGQENDSEIEDTELGGRGLTQTPVCTLQGIAANGVRVSPYPLS